MALEHVARAFDWLELGDGQGAAFELYVAGMAVAAARAVCLRVPPEWQPWV